ncbi:MAG: hypothetical protein ABII74_01665 [Elusimicrobiota bacterium]
MEMDANMVVNPLRGNRKGLFYSRKTLVAKRLKIIKEFIQPVFFAALLLRVTVLSAVSYDDYQQYRRQVERPAVQQAAYQSNYVNPSAVSINTRSEFLNNRDYAPLIALARFDHNLVNFLQDKVAPNINLSDYAGYTPLEKTNWESYSNLSGRYETQTFRKIEKNETGYRSLEISTMRGLGKVTDKIDKIVYGANNLPKEVRITSADLVGNTYRQNLSNLVYSPSVDQPRLTNLQMFSRFKAGESGTYGFDKLFAELKDLPEPPHYQVRAFQLNVEDCQGKETKVEFSELSWRQNQITGFKAELQTSADSPSPILMQVTSSNQNIEISAWKNNQLVLDRAILGKDLRGNELIAKLQLGVNPLEILGSSKLQLGEAQLVFLAKSYDANDGTFPGGKKYSLDYGITAKKSVENEIKIRLAQWEQISPRVTRGIIGGLNLKTAPRKILAMVEGFVSKKITEIVERSNQLPQYVKVENDWQLEWKPVNGLKLKVENGRLFSDGKFATKEGVVSEVNFVFQGWDLKAISGRYTKNDGQTVMLTTPKAEKINNLIRSITMKREGWFGQLKTLVVSVWNKVVSLWNSFTGQGTLAQKEIKSENKKAEVWPSLKMVVPEPRYDLVIAGENVGHVKSGDLSLAPDGNDGEYQLLSPIKVGEETILQAVVRKEETKIVFQTAIKEAANGDKIYLSKDGQLFKIRETIHEGEDQKQEIILIRENLQTEFNQGAILQAGILSSIYQGKEDVGQETSLSLTEGAKQLYTLSVKNEALKADLKKNFQEEDYDKISIGMGKLVENKSAIDKLSVQEKEIYSQAEIIIAKTNTGYAKALNQVGTMISLGAQPEEFSGQEKIKPSAGKYYREEKSAAMEGLTEAAAGTFLLAKFGLISPATKEELKSTQGSIIIGISNLQPEAKTSQIAKGALKGDFIEKPTLWNIAGQITAGLSPAGFLGDIRDVGANSKTVWQSKGSDGKLGLSLAFVGFVPLFGDTVKTLVNTTKAAKALRNAERIGGAAKTMLKEVNAEARIARVETKIINNGSVAIRSLVRESLPVLKGKIKNAFESGEYTIKTFKKGDVIYRSPWIPNELVENPGRWFGTRRTVTTVGTESQYNVSKWGNPLKKVRVYEFSQDVTVYYGKVAGGKGYQVLLPDDIMPNKLLKFKNELPLK